MLNMIAVAAKNSQPIPLHSTCTWPTLYNMNKQTETITIARGPPNATLLAAELPFCSWTPVPVEDPAEPLADADGPLLPEAVLVVSTEFVIVANPEDVLDALPEELDIDQ